MPETGDRATVKIFRFDPEKETTSQYKTYTVPVPYQGWTVLQVLHHIYENQDPTLAFRYGCNGNGPARCGGCALEVNGVPALSCQRLAEKEMVIRPHSKFKVIKDLVVDFEEEKRGKR